MDDRQFATRAAERQAELINDGEVVHVITGLEVGGAEMLLLELCREDHRRGRASSVASLMSEGPMRQRFAEIGVEVAGLGMRRGESILPGLMRLVRFIRRRRPQIVQGWLYQGNLGAAAATWLSGVMPRPKLAWSIHGAVPDFGCYPARLRRAVRLGARLSPFVDGILYNGGVALDEHRGIGYRSRLTRLFSNGIDLAKFHREPGSRQAARRALSLPEDAVVVIAVGRDDPMKNWPGMLAAAEAAAAQKVWLIAVGDGTEQLPAGSRRTLLGRREDMPALYAAADIFMLASDFGEGTSVALSEAMASGLPVVVTDVGDNGAIADGAGAVVPPRDASALARALAQLAADPGLQARAGSAARARAVCQFGVDRLYASFSGFYEALMADPLICGSTIA
jgi:glycosyltransferase involved in cell wall biosynthesis